MSLIQVAVASLFLATGTVAQFPSIVGCNVDANAIQAVANDFFSHLNQPDGCGNGFTGNQQGFSKNLAAMWIRSFFHDAGSWDAGALSGGLDGSIANEIGDEEAKGLAAGLPLQVAGGQYVAPFSSSFPTGPVQPADLISIAAVTAIQHCGGPSIPVNVGLQPVPVGLRNNVDAIPSDPHFTVAQLFPFFQSMSLDKGQMFALVTGSHTMGGAHGGVTPSVTSLDFQPFDDTPTVFDNNIFKKLLANPRDCVLPIDCNMAQDPDLQFLLRAWAQDESSFFSAYHSAFLQMMSFNAALFVGSGPTIQSCPFLTNLHNFGSDTAAGNGTVGPTPPPGNAATVSFTFASDGHTFATQVTGTLSASQPIVVVYDMRRALCAGDSRTVTMGFIDSNGNANGDFAQLNVIGGTGSVTIQPGTLHAGQVQTWFKCDGDNTVFDSNFSNNWALNLGN
ncbi:hypothetical protein HK101_007546 [Irineochytrium annulatum]|nr:hypothetical protein HK101_007546 [Irineochytrium annulatum]